MDGSDGQVWHWVIRRCTNGSSFLPVNREGVNGRSLTNLSLWPSMFGPVPLDLTVCPIRFMDSF